MPLLNALKTAGRVALLAEGVDRNNDIGRSEWKTKTSPSSRRAWIEITMSRSNGVRSYVALLAEGVDRNQPETRGW